MASAASNQTITTSETTLFDPASSAKKCTEFCVAVRSTASFPLLVNVVGLHESGEFMGIPAGASVTYRLGYNGLGKITAKGDGGSCDGVDYGVISKITNS